jgi:PAS domain S-box-containing protein
MEDQNIASLLAKVANLTADLEAQLTIVNGKNADLEIILETITEHSTDLENQIYQKNQKLLSYIDQANIVTAAAAAVEQNTFDPDSLADVAARTDELGQLARVFTLAIQTVKTREEELRRSEAQIRALLDAIPDAIARIDRQGIYLDFKPASDVNHPVARESIIGKHLDEVLSIELAQQRLKYIEQALQSGKLQSYEYQIFSPQGVGYEEARIVCSGGDEAILIIRDITQRKQAEEALRIAEEQYRSIFENALEGIFQSNMEGQFIKVNSAMAKIYGYNSPAEMLSSITSISDRIYVDPSKWEEFRRRIAEAGAVKDFEYQVYRKDGSIIWIEEDTRAVRDRDGNILYCEGIIQDITDRKSEEANLRRQLEELQIEIDHTKRVREVAMITQSGYFQEIQTEVASVDLDEFWS